MGKIWAGWAALGTMAFLFLGSLAVFLATFSQTPTPDSQAVNFMFDSSFALFVVAVLLDTPLRRAWRSSHKGLSLRTRWSRTPITISLLYFGTMCFALLFVFFAREQNDPRSIAAVGIGFSIIEGLNIGFNLGLWRLRGSDYKLDHGPKQAGGGPSVGGSQEVGAYAPPGHAAVGSSWVGGTAESQRYGKGGLSETGEPAPLDDRQRD
ncbi:MAG: hypothetical protein ACR2M0_12795 [Chloroflexia bacterium]